MASKDRIKNMKVYLYKDIPENILDFFINYILLKSNQAIILKKPDFHAIVPQQYKNEDFFNTKGWMSLEFSLKEYEEYYELIVRYIVFEYQEEFQALTKWLKSYIMHPKIAKELRDRYSIQLNTNNTLFQVQNENQNASQYSTQTEKNNEYPNNIFIAKLKELRAINEQNELEQNQYQNPIQTNRQQVYVTNFTNPLNRLEKNNQTDNQLFIPQIEDDAQPQFESTFIQPLKSQSDSQVFEITNNNNIVNIDNTEENITNGNTNNDLNITNSITNVEEVTVNIEDKEEKASAPSDKKSSKRKKKDNSTDITINEDNHSIEDTDTDIDIDNKVHIEPEIIVETYKNDSENLIVNIDNSQSLQNSKEPEQFNTNKINTIKKEPVTQNRLIKSANDFKRKIDKLFEVGNRSDIWEFAELFIAELYNSENWYLHGGKYGETFDAHIDKILFDKLTEVFAPHTKEIDYSKIYTLAYMKAVSDITATINDFYAEENIIKAVTRECPNPKIAKDIVMATSVEPITFNEILQYTRKHNYVKSNDLIKNLNVLKERAIIIVDKNVELGEEKYYLTPKYTDYVVYGNYITENFN